MSKQITDIQEEDSLLINPQDVQKRRKQTIVDNMEDDIEIAKHMERTGNKYYNQSGRVAVELETMGRFNIPSIMHFSDFTTQDINDIALSRQEDLLKVLVIILNRCKNPDAECDIENMLLEEVMEVLIGIKMEFNTLMHDHPWVCECQSGLSSDSQTVNHSEIDLSTLQYKSIQDADQEMRNYYSEIFEKLTSEQFQEYLKIKYKNEPDTDLKSITVDKEIQSLKIIEPFGFRDNDGNIYSFRFIRLKDLLNAHKMVQFKYNSKIKAIKNKQNTPTNNIVEFKNQKDTDIEELQYQQAKDMILYAKAFTLAKYNGKDLTKDEAIGYYKKLPRSVLFRVNNFFEQMKFGVSDERELVCPLCGEASRRLLRQEFNPFEFLPLDADTVNTATTTPGLNVFIGI